MVERGSSGDESCRSWKNDNRQLPFLNILRKDYLKFAPEDNPGMKEKLKDIIDSRKVFDPSKEFMLHLLNSESEQGN